MQDEAAGEESLPEDAMRLACQLTITSELNGMHVGVPSSSHNMLEVPLWMRKR
jgi:hypothetical protein